jgi:hypothetical protein
MKEHELRELRKNFRLLLLENPNYFGNLSEAKLPGKEYKPVTKIISNTFFEELTCLSFNPLTNELKAVVKVKQTSGYSGGPCTTGSKEYVRFYVDYNRDGNWVDEGAVNFDVHDLPFEEDLCYGVNLKINPKKKSCCDDPPVLPRVRAILSWHDEPVAGQPDWPPVWGNRIEANIQIAPRNRTDLICLLKKKMAELDIAVDLSKLELLAKALPMKEEAAPLPQAQPLALQKKYGDKVEEARFAFKLMHALAKEPTQPAFLDKAKMLKASGVDLAKASKFLQTAKFNTTYEELRCVGLDRDLSILHAGILLKVPYGYSENLCHEGSLEYVAFYLDAGSGWEHLGTTSVSVHDIPEIPKDGLWYHAALPVSLSKHQKEFCNTGQAKVRAILSWNALPPPNDPDYVAPWGDWEECHIEIKPLPKGVEPGKVIPVIESLGGMPVNMINGSGYANGTNTAGLKAVDSPFDGLILIKGFINNAPDWTKPGTFQLRYRLMVKRPSDSGYQPSLRAFTIQVTKVSGGIVSPQVSVTQTPTHPDGWLDYYPDFFPPDTVEVDEKLLGVFYPGEEGLHELYAEMYDPNNPVATNVASNTVRFMVDKKAPVVDIEITSGTGNCGVFTKGDIIAGTFSITDAHCWDVSLSVTPATEAHGALPCIGSCPGPASLTYGLGLPGAGTSGTWELDTGAMDPCGYNIRIRGEDRTIVDSRWFGYENWDIEGFCLEE